MALKVGYLQRYLIIIDQVKRKKYISMDELVDAVQVEIANYVDPDAVGLSKRTIQRDIREIDNNLNITIKYSKRENGYYIPEEEDDNRSHFKMMAEQLNLLGAMYMDRKLANFVFPERRKPRGMEHLPPLIHAIKNSFIAEFFYRKYDNSWSHIRKVEPYALKESQGRWYLLAMEIDGRLEERGRIKTWGLDRIQDLTITTKFSKNPVYDIEKEFSHSFGVYSDRDKEVEEVILSFTPMGGKYNDSFPLHESQETLIDDDHEFRIRLKVKITYDFIMEILSQSQNMKVIAPLHLKNKLIEIHREAIKMLK